MTGIEPVTSCLQQTGQPAKRTQGLVVCPAASPFRGFFDARPGVTLALSFTARVECQSRTVRA
jgi:hypothetical protein